MPNVWITLGVHCYNNSHPVQYARVVFSAAPEGLLEFSSSLSQTDGMGRGRIAVRANPNATSIPDNTLVKVTATWKDPSNGQIVLTRSVGVSLRTYPAAGTYASFSPTPAWQTRPVIMYFDDPSLGKAAGPAALGRMNWNVNNRIQFAPASTRAGADVVFKGAYLRGRPTDFAITVNNTIQFNMAALDGNYWANRSGKPELDIPEVVPIEWRSHTGCTATHEVGHLLGLTNHSDQREYSSIMCTTIIRYFVGGTTKPDNTDWNIILAHY